jgi:pimeloyl-ACP methyl ester carboxylesterase
VRVLIAAGVVIAVMTTPAAAETPSLFCGPSQRPCTRVAVPLDRSGTVPGEVSLQVERRPAAHPMQPPLLLLAGGPGQSATDAFPPSVLPDILGPVLSQRDLVVFDQRGTGLSDLLRCPQLERAPPEHPGAAIPLCAQSLGGRSAFYTTLDSVEDIEAVRRALGADRIALLGVSYGTKVALAYAAEHPDRVDRLVLDSVVGPDGPDPLYRDTFAATPRVLRELCRGACKGITPDPVRDVARLVGRLRKRPMRGYIVDQRGRRHGASLSRFDVLSLLLAGDLNPIVRAASPGVIRSSLRGDPIPMLRLLSDAEQEDDLSDPRAFSVATFAATTCEELPFPWKRGAPFATRREQAAAAVGAAPLSTFRPFDRLTALDSDVLELCERWPTKPPERPSIPAPPADVPVLMLEGGTDLRTPVEGATRLARGMRQAQVLVVPSAGHSALGSDLGSCAQTAVRRFLTAQPPLARCPRGPSTFPPSAPPPSSLREVRPVRGVPGRAGRTLAAVRLTVRDGERHVLMQLFQQFTQILQGKAPSGGLVAGGLRGGRFSFSSSGGFKLHRYELVPGVRITGSLRQHGGNRPLTGRLRITGRAAARGSVRIGHGRAVGVLGGRFVATRLRLDVKSNPEELLAARAARRLPVPIR